MKNSKGLNLGQSELVRLRKQWRELQQGYVLEQDEETMVVQNEFGGGYPAFDVPDFSILLTCT